MKKRYILILSLLVSNLRADDSQTLEKLVALTEKSVALQEKLEERLQKFDKYIALYGNSVQDIFLNLIIPQVIEENKDMTPEQQKEANEVVKMIGVLVGVDLEKVEKALGIESQNETTLTSQGFDLSEKMLDDTK